MSRFDIFANPDKNSRNIPYLVDVQSNVISGLATRIVVPIRPLPAFSSVTLPPNLFPIIVVNGEEHVMDTPQLGAIPYNQDHRSMNQWKFLRTLARRSEQGS